VGPFAEPGAEQPSLACVGAACSENARDEQEKKMIVRDASQQTVGISSCSPGIVWPLA
jgi:hypothetical protein